MNIPHKAIERAFGVAGDLLQAMRSNAKKEVVEGLANRLHGFLEIWYELSKVEEDVKKDA